MSKQSFEEFYAGNEYDGKTPLEADPFVSYMRPVWDYQQKTIDSQAEKIKELEQEVEIFTREKIEFRLRITREWKLEEKIKELRLLLNKRIVFQRLKVAEEEIEKLRESLEFYADINNWELKPARSAGFTKRIAVIKDCDMGDKARKALAQLEEQTK